MSNSISGFTFSDTDKFNDRGQVRNPTLSQDLLGSPRPNRVLTIRGWPWHYRPSVTVVWWLHCSLAFLACSSGGICTQWLPNELPEESDQFRFLRVVCLVNLKVLLAWFWLNLRLWGSPLIPLDPIFHLGLSYHCPSRFIRSRRSTPLLVGVEVWSLF